MDLEKYDLNKEIFTTFVLEVVLRMNYGFKITENYKCDNQNVDHNDDSNNCPICLDDLEGLTVVQPPCGHKYDYYCLVSSILEFKQFSCPECSIDPKNKKKNINYK